MRAYATDEYSKTNYNFLHFYRPGNNYYEYVTDIIQIFFLYVNNIFKILKRKYFLIDKGSYFPSFTDNIEKGVVLMKKAIFIIAALTLTGCTTREAQTAAIPLEAQAGSVITEPEAGQAKASFTTWYRKSGKNRSINIELAAEAINGYVIMPGATFSFNGTVGSTGKANGYKLATVYYNKKKTKGYGGGVCQVSTTLFNAAEMAGMEIVERHIHPEAVPYVEAGRDATTSGRGKLDLKLKNISPDPMTIKASAEKGVLTVEIY
jgi:hypothetical protein